MKYTMVIALIIPTLLWAQPFEFVQELDSIQAIVDGHTLGAAWIGGYTETCPRAVDLDGDGDFDLLVGWENGKIEYWENTGTPFEAFYELQDREFSGIDVGYDTKLALWDMDSDGDSDMLVRGAYPMMVLENIGNPTNPQFEVIEDSLRDNEGNFIYGFTFDTADIDGDGDEDLFFGDSPYTGYGIKYYQNIGDSSQYSFFFMTSNFAGIVAGSLASPLFCDIEADGDLDLFIGTWDGTIMYYRNDGTPQQYNYTFVTNQWMGVDVAEYAIPEFFDIDADGDYDLFVGKHNNETHTVPGDMHFYRNMGTPQEPQMVLENQMYLTLDFEDGSRPGIIDVNFDGKSDLFVHAYYVGWLKNVGTPSSPVFELQSYNVAGSGFLASTVGYGDLNEDEHEDMVIGVGWSGVLEFWFNNGDTLAPEFYYATSMTVGQLAGGPVLADMDGDGDNDLIVHVTSFQFDQYLYYYENQGTPQQFDFVLTTINYQGWAGLYGIESIVDFDGDDDFDVIAKDSSDAMTYFANIGTPQNAVFATPILMNFVNLDTYDTEACDFYDVDHDGDMDAFFGSILGGIRFYRNVTGEPAVPPLRRHPQAGLQLTLGPNPANPVTWASFHLPAPQKATLAVYNLLGQKVATLAQGLQPPGTHTYLWNASQFASGVYVVRLEMERDMRVEKIVVLR